jgi:hypothetical protein
MDEIANRDRMRNLIRQGRKALQQNPLPSNRGVNAMKSKILGLLAVGSMVGPITANAQSTTYTYQGATLNGGLDISPPAGSTSFSVPPILPVGTLSGSVTLSAPLGDNLNNFSVTPTEITMLTGGVGLEFRSTVAFSTNGKGAIDGWSMSLAGFVGGPGGWTETLTSSDIGGVGGDFATISANCTAFFPPSLLPPQSFNCGSTGSNTKPGVWTSPPAKTPEIDPASAASGLTLLLGGVAVLRGQRKRES